MIYRSITYGKMTEEEVFKKIVETIVGHENEYEVYVGTDSQVGYDTKVASVIVLYEIGKGGKFFYNISHTKKYTKNEIADRMYMEAEKSIELSKRFTSFLKDWKIDFSNIVIHVDLGKKGKTRNFIEGIVGWITAEGFNVEVKPGSIAASVVADRYSK